MWNKLPPSLTEITPATRRVLIAKKADIRTRTGSALTRAPSSSRTDGDSKSDVPPASRNRTDATAIAVAICATLKSSLIGAGRLNVSAKQTETIAARAATHVGAMIVAARNGINAIEPAPLRGRLN